MAKTHGSITRFYNLWKEVASIERQFIGLNFGA